MKREPHFITQKAIADLPRGASTRLSKFIQPLARAHPGKSGIFPLPLGRDAFAARIGIGRLFVSPSCSLVHSPLGLKYETKLDAELKGWLAFAEEKLAEIASLARLINHDGNAALTENRTAITQRRQSPRIHDPSVKLRVAGITPGDLRRQGSFSVRHAKQQVRLNLPSLPTTSTAAQPRSRWESN